MAEERGLEVDIDGFNSAMEKARQKAINARGKVTYVSSNAINIGFPYK